MMKREKKFKVKIQTNYYQPKKSVIMHLAFFPPPYKKLLPRREEVASTVLHDNHTSTLPRNTKK